MNDIIYDDIIRDDFFLFSISYGHAFCFVDDIDLMKNSFRTAFLYGSYQGIQDDRDKKEKFGKAEILIRNILMSGLIEVYDKEKKHQADADKDKIKGVEEVIKDDSNIGLFDMIFVPII